MELNVGLVCVCARMQIIWTPCIWIFRKVLHAYEKIGMDFKNLCNKLMYLRFLFFFLRDRDTDMQAQRIFIHQFTPQMSTRTKTGTRNLELSSGLPCGLQGPKYFTHHQLLLRACTSRKLEAGAKLAFKLRHSNTGCGCHNVWLYHQITYSSLNF